ncbi:MAG: outer membrane lipoprotein carrier protein LolA [Sandaracinaceae bacterium]
MTRRLALLLAVAALGGGLGRGRAQDLTLDELLARFAALPGRECRFDEEKTLGTLLAVPLRSEGRILFDPPGRFLRQVERPEPSAMLIVGDRLRMRDAGGPVRELPIDRLPALRGFLDSFRAVLAGDRAALERYYAVELRAASPAGGWTLILTPRQPDLARLIATITMAGRGPRLDEMRVVEVTGDVTVTRFHDVDPDRRFSAAEQRRLFRLER